MFCQSLYTYILLIIGTVIFPYKTINVRFFANFLKKVLVVRKKFVPLQSALEKRADFLGPEAHEIFEVLREQKR